MQAYVIRDDALCYDDMARGYFEEMQPWQDEWKVGL